MKKSLLTLFILFFPFLLFSQTEEETSTLYADTLYSDINTASYYELLNWCRELELNTSGNADFLKNQLFSHYGIDLGSVSSKESGSDTIVKIVSADQSEYYTLEEIDEDYVRISGRVKLIVRQPAKNITHTIEADSVLFNQTTDSMTASGNILYTKEENGKEENYSGDNFTFNVQSWKGVILKGDFRKSQEVGDKQLEFIFSGEAIKKGEGDVVVLDDGAITSSDPVERYYQIKAKKIWILGPDEWAILSGFLYVGHVPLLYIPFYHLPGNDLFFNPVIGDEYRRGFFVQTTTYLLGQKDSSQEDDSFFINVADTDESYNLVPEGLYLFKEKGEPEKTAGSDYIKYKLDYYSRLGGYTAIEGSIAKLGESEFKNLTFDVGLGVTRSIKDTKGSNFQYTNYFEENDFQASWNSSDLFGLTLPFRWGMSFGFSLLNFTTSFEYMTDPYFKSDFSNRGENFDWLNYVLAQTTEQEDVEESSQTSLNWSIQGRVNIPNEWASNYISSFTLNPLKVNMTWNSKDNSDYDEPADPDEPYDPYDPGSKFFYPSTITWPQTTLSLSGVLFEYKSGTVESIPVDRLEKREALKSPWVEDDSDYEGNQSDDSEGPEGPDRLKDLPITGTQESFYAKVNYSLSGYFNFISYTNSDAWDTPSDIDFDILKSILTSNNTFSLNYTLQFLGKMVSLTGKNSFAANYLDYFGASGDISPDEENREQDGRKLNWNNTLDFSVKPLKNVPYMSNSSISYDFDTTLFTYAYDEGESDFQDQLIQWNDDFVTAHKVALNFDFTIPVLSAALSFDTTLPPLDIVQSINPSLQLTLWKWVSKVSGKILYNDEEGWGVDPLTITTSFNPLEKAGLTGSFTYDFEGQEHPTPSSLATTLKLWGFSGTFNMAYTTDYEWDKDNRVLVDEGKKFVPTSIALAYDYEYESPLLWKNRITMSAGINSTFKMNLQQYNLTSLGVKFFYKLHIFEFLDLNFSVSSSNDYMYLYFPYFRDYYGITTEYSFFGDLIKSFNFFSSNQQDRYESYFNMDSLELSLVHKLHDWDLELTYSGRPVVDEGAENSRWDSTFSILVRWNPIEKLKVRTDYTEKYNAETNVVDPEWNVDTEFE